MNPVGAGTRRYVRYAVSGNVENPRLPRGRATVVRLGFGGAAIRYEGQADLGQTCLFHFRLPEGEFTARCKVVYARPALHPGLPVQEVGFAFTHLTAADNRNLQGILSQLAG